jgi:CRISPR-associated protein Cmr6
MFARWEAMLKVYRAEQRRVQVRGRMVVGLGSESLLEASICLHHTYGVPYIPGSALKGLAASYAHHYLKGEWCQGETFHTLVFGNTNEAGYITFLDALPLPGSGHNGRALAPDVITVHHQKYYQDAGVPSDSDDPNPIPFLSATGKYLIALAAPDFPQPTRWVDLTFQILEEALDKLGIGAKTSSGYGRITFIDPPIKPADPQIKIAEGYIREVMAIKNVAGEINAYYQKWKLLTLDEARKLLAQAIVEKVELGGRTKASAGKLWYEELRAFLDAH